MSTTFIGIDPGKTGAIAAIYSDQTIWLTDCPTIKVGKNKTELDFRGMVSTLKQHKNNSYAVIEKVSAMPGQGVTSMFSFGKNFGAWQGILASLDIPFELVTPQAWKKVMMAGQPKEKDAARLVASQMFPQASEELKRKKDIGRADALLMAEYIRRKKNQVAA